MAFKHIMKTLGLQSMAAVLLFTAGSYAFAENNMQQVYIGPLPQPVASPQTQEKIASPGDETASPKHAALGPLEISVRSAILLSLENNRALKVEKFNPAIRRTAEEETRAAFDPVLAGTYSRSRERREIESRPSSTGVNSEIALDLELSEYLPTGTDIDLEISTQKTWASLYSDDLHESRLGLSITQALLQGAGLEYNLASLRQARLDTVVSLYELRGFAESLVAQVEETYWDYALTQQQIKIFEESLNLAQQQKDETEEMIKIGYLAESELAAAQAEIALRREGLINARSNLEKIRLQLLRLLNPPDSNQWQREINLLHQPAMPEVTLDDIESHVEVALRMRPDLNQARLKVRQGDLEIVKTRNGLLPRLDFFISLGKSGYADSFARSVRDIDEDSYDAGAGLSLEFPLVNRKAQARYQASLFSRSQADDAVKNFVQLVQVDVRSAYIEVNRTGEQITATAATRALQEEKARIEAEKFRVGKSTTLLVAQAQRDLLSSRISEIQAITNYLKALIELYRLEGSLLERRGILAPGNVAVEN